MGGLERARYLDRPGQHVVDRQRRVLAEPVERGAALVELHGEVGTAIWRDVGVVHDHHVGMPGEAARRAALSTEALPGPVVEDREGQDLERHPPVE